MSRVQWRTTNVFAYWGQGESAQLGWAYLGRDGVSRLEVRHELLDHLAGAVLQDEVVLDHQQRRPAVALRRAPRPQHSVRHRATALTRRQRDATLLDRRRVVRGIDRRVPRPRHH